MNVDLYPHQLKAIGQLETGSILCGGVGSGKSRTSLAYFFLRVCGGSLKINGVGETRSMLRPRDLYIITSAKKRDSLDWEEEAILFGLSTDAFASFDGVRVTVDSWNNVQKYENLKNTFVIFDEQRVVGSGAWVKAFLKIARNNAWILLSATPGDTWMDYVPVFIANGFYRNKSEFVEEHVVYSRFAKYPKVEKYLNEFKLRKLRDSILVDMPYPRGTVRHIENIVVPYNVELFNRVMKDRWNPYKGRPIREAGEYFSVMRRVVNSDLRRLTAIVDLSFKHPRLIVFYNFNYELEILRILGDIIEVPVAEWNGHKHEPVPEAERWVYLVQYSAGAEAWNCTETDAIAFYSLNYSYRVLEQAMGRIDRLDTLYTDLYYYQIRSTAQIDIAIMKALKQKKTFNQSMWKEKP